MNTVSGIFRQIETREEMELEFPRGFQNQAYTAHMVQGPATVDGDPDTTVCILTPVGSQEEENMNAIADINDEANAAGQENEYDFKITGNLLVPDHYKLGHKEDEKNKLYNGVLEPLSLADDDERYPDYYVFATNVETHIPDGEYVLTFNAGAANFYIEEVEGGVSKKTGKEYEAFTSYKLGTLGWTPDQRRSLGIYEARLPRGQVQETVERIYETHMPEGSFLGSCTCSGSLRFYVKGADAESGDESPALTPVFYIKQFYAGNVVTPKDGGTSNATRTSAPVARRELTESQKAAQEKMKAIKSKSKVKAPEYSEDF